MSHKKRARAMKLLGSGWLWCPFCDKLIGADTDGLVLYNAVLLVHRAPGRKHVLAIDRGFCSIDCAKKYAIERRLAAILRRANNRARIRRMVAAGHYPPHVEVFEMHVGGKERLVSAPVLVDWDYDRERERRPTATEWLHEWDK